MEPGPAGSYRAAGVDLEAAQRAKKGIREWVRATFNTSVVRDWGFFGGLYKLQGFRSPVLVSSVDGVGTKLKVAALMDRYHTLGIDLVHHCVNDVFSCGARPLFFLDYIAMGRLLPEKVEALVRGMAQACQRLGVVLLGGETAEMPGVYPEGSFDLVGFMVGVVEEERILDGSGIVPGDLLLGLASSGLHTNGYSLVRKVFGLDHDPSPLHRFYPELGATLGEVLLVPHRCYYPLLEPALPDIKGMAHITGGGLVENVPRVLPPGLAACFLKGSWQVPEIFRLIQRVGRVAEEEMYRVFNMGLGMVLVCGEKGAEAVKQVIPEVKVVGRVVEQIGAERVTFG